MAELHEHEVLERDESLASTLTNRGNFGYLKKGVLYLSMTEALYLLNKKKIVIYKGKKELSSDEFHKYGRKSDKRFNLRYKVYSDLRERGYITKTALKYGADFRVYPRGKRMSEEHAKWVVFAVHEAEVFDWKKFAAMMRVAHSVRKNLLLAVLDDEGDVTYYEVNWIKP